MTRVALAVDVGGTKLETALVTDAGELLAGSRSRQATGPDATPATLREALQTAITTTLTNLPPDATLTGTGIGSAGPIDRTAGTVRPVNMPGVHGFALVDAVQAAAAHAGHPVKGVLGHDGGCLALAESWLGATAGTHASLSIVVSTGIGGGFVLDGRYAPGASGNAGHLGQMHRDGETTLEEIASGPASVTWARGQGWAGSTGEELGRDAASGISIARAAVERSARAVGETLADATTLIDLDVVAIGGGFSHVAPDYIDLVQAALTATAVHDYARRTRVVRAALGNEGPLIGAAALVLR